MASIKHTADGGGLAAALRWPPDSDKFRFLAGIVLLLFAGYALSFVALTAIRLRTQPVDDFFALWSTSRFVFEHPAAQVYDPAALKAYQMGLGMDAGSSYPFPYPPSFLLALWPLALLPLGPAFVLAIGGTLAAYVWATVGSHWRSPLPLAALVAPTTTITAVAGQAGFLAAALLIGGFRLAGTRPVVAGILFGLATYKPQMGILVPVALVAAGLWRTIAAACATVVCLVLVTSLAFGTGIWSTWIAHIFQYSDQFAAESGAIAHLMPTVSAALIRLGAAPAAAHAGQVGMALIAAAIVWRCFRVGPTPLAAAALFVATFLASPHAFVYDMPPVAAAVLWTIAVRQYAGDAFGTVEMVILLLALVSPMALVSGASAVPAVQLTLVLLLIVIAWQCERQRRGDISVVAFGPARREV